VEIFQYLHLSTRRLIAVVVVALLVGAATAFVLVKDSTDSYEAEAVIFLGQVLPADRSTFAVAPFAGDLDALLSLDPIREAVATASGVDNISTTDLTTRKISNGTAVGVRAVALEPELAESMASEAAKIGLSTLLDQELTREQRNLEAVERQLLEVRAELEQFRGSNAVFDPTFEFRTAVEERRAVAVQLSDPQITAANQEALELRQQELNDEVDRLAPLQAPYNELDRALLGAESALSNAKQGVAAADAVLASATSGDFVVIAPATAISNQSTLLAGVVASMIVVVLLSIGLFVRMDRRRSAALHEELPKPESRGQRGDQTPSGSQLAAVAANAAVAADPQDSVVSEVSDVSAASTHDDDTSTGPSTASDATPEEEQSPACVCGRVFRTERGYSTHRQYCDTYQQSHTDDDDDDDDGDGDDGDVDVDSATAADGAKPGAPVRVLVSELGTSEHGGPGGSFLLKQALEAAGLSEGTSFTIVNAPDGFTQVRQAEQAIDDGVSVILLIGSDPTTSATIAKMADEAGVEVVEQSATGFASDTGNGAETEHHEDEDEDEDEDDDDEPVVRTARNARPLARPTPMGPRRR
jgi:methylmalonyl-CoA mutase cobalamin-binding subunit